MVDLSNFIEHTILKPDTTIADVRRLCEEAQQHKFAAVCVPPLYVRDACRILGEDRRVRVVTVVGFPMGYSAIPAKSEEIKRAIDEGADDIDAVINIAAAKSENWNHVERDIEAVARATHMRGRTLKLILECGLLLEPGIKKVSELALAAHVEWLKTGTGFHGHPATVEMVRSLRAMAPDNVRIKAAGGIRSAKDAEALIAAGANRIGTSASLEIIGVKTVR
ncbi:MAG: deoxyribose-phosphate aldolase [Lewinellaceae bacterium]|nr:deoxyribose-phosphate aldolase [Lewinellaceae bacterium]